MEELTPNSRAQLQDIINELQTMFLQMVSSRRDKTVDELRAVIGDGRIMTGTSAADVGLIDEVGDENDARLWLQTTHDVSTDLPVIEWAIEDPIAWWREAGASMSTAIFGKSLLSERLTLDGILALWHPSFNE
jgi:protease-4